MGLVSCLGPMCLGHESAGVIVQIGSNLAAKARAADAAAAALAKDADAPVGAKEARAVVGQRALTVGDRVALEPGSESTSEWLAEGAYLKRRVDCAPTVGMGSTK